MIRQNEGVAGQECLYLNSTVGPTEVRVFSQSFVRIALSGGPGRN